LVGRSQPAVTRLIQDLETELTFALFDRSGPRLAPTEKALQFHAEVERSLAGMRNIQSRAEAIARGKAVRVEVAAIPA
uniref:LysR family transcriptional regulator n=1 Tax=Klebsiella pneumoniae TaxID=573 RepID=UPI0013D36486